MINHIEKGYGLIQLIKDSGYELTDTYGVWTSNNDVAVQAIIDGFDPLPYTQAEALKEISQHANDLIDRNINPIKQRRIEHESNLSLARQSRGQQGSNEKLDAIIAASVYPEAVYAQYDIEEAIILAQTDWKLIDVVAAKANLDGVS